MGFIGAGRRMQTIYLPICRKLAPGITLVGFTRRDATQGKTTADAIGVPYFETLERLVNDGKPDLLIVCVPPAANAGVVASALKIGIPILMETPIALSARAAKDLVRAAVKARVLVGVLEQKPFLPREQMKQFLIASGVFGKIVCAENDFRSYDYHAIAQLRAYIGREHRPVRASAVTRVVTLPAYACKANDSSAGPRQETWNIGTIAFDNDAIAIHAMTSAYKAAPFRTVQSLRAYGERGSLVNDEATVVDDNGQTRIIQMEPTVGEFGQMQKITATLPSGRVMAWENPFPELPFTEDDSAIAAHLLVMARAIRGRGQPLYNVEDACTDVAVMEAIRASGNRNGRPVKIGGALLPAVLYPRWWKNTLKKVIIRLWKK